MKIIHAVSSAPFRLKRGRDARSRCGKIACVEVLVGFQCEMVDAAGNEFFGSGDTKSVTCKKCINLITTGTINGTQHPAALRTAIAAQRPVETRR